MTVSIRDRWIQPSGPRWGPGTRRLFLGGLTVVQSPIPLHPLLEHPCQDRDVSVHVVVDPHFPLVGTLAVQTPRVLDEGPFPGDGKSEEQGGEGRGVER